jgi:RecB family endonuclease NucS
MTKIIKNDLYESLAQREFNPAETLQVIQHNRSIYWSWGVEKKVNYNDKALLLIVNGHHHKGLLVITLAFNDTYSFHLINDDGTIKESIHEVYFDELQERIDKKIEYIETYK